MSNRCALINGVCPETSDRTKKRYCPNWKVGIPSVDPEKGIMIFPTFTGCYIDIAPAYAIATAREACHSAAAFNDARNKVLLANGQEDGSKSHLITLGLVMLGGLCSQQRKGEFESSPLLEEKIRNVGDV